MYRYRPFCQLFYHVRVENCFSNWVFAVLAIFGHRYGCRLGIDVARYDDAQPDACRDAV